MKKILFIIFMISYLPTHLFSQESNRFTIIGKTKGIKDSTKLYLRKNESGSIAVNSDSTYVIHNAFRFTGTVSEPCEYMIHTGYTGWQMMPPESFQYISFWVSNTTIFLTDDVGNLRLSKISGSELQNDNNAINQLLVPLAITSDSLTRAFMKLSPSDTLKIKVLRERNNRNYLANQQICMDFIKTHPRSLLSAHILNIYKTTWGKEKTMELFGVLDKTVQELSYGKSIKVFIQQSYNISIGGPFVDIELPGLDGNLIKLTSLKGKYILLEFWASSCGPCRAEHPKLLELYTKYKEKGFEIYAVCLDEKKESWKQTVTHDKINWITESDLKGSSNCEAAMIYGVTGIPQNYLIDQEGKIIAKDIRGVALVAKMKEIFPSVP